MVNPEVVVVGAGPHALTVAAFLTVRQGFPLDRVVVVDPSGTWLAAWNARFAAHAIPHLRSTLVHQPDPDPWAYPDGPAFVHRCPASRFAVPTTDGFARFCCELIDRLDVRGAVIERRALRLSPRGPRGTVVELDDGTTLRARSVVLAHNPSRPRLPDWADRLRGSAPAGRVTHSDGVVLDAHAIPGERIAVVGGGLTAAQLAIAAVGRGADVTLLSRRRFRVRPFDVQPGWMGPRCLDRFWRETDYARRRRQVDRARGGGSVTPGAVAALRAHAASTLDLRPSTAVSEAHWNGSAAELLTTGGDVIEVDRVWLATGSVLDAATDPLLADLVSAHPTEIHDGLPRLHHTLAWPGTSVHLSGGYAALTVGPAARNIAGARMAARCIAPEIRRRWIAAGGRELALRGTRPSGPPERLPTATHTLTPTRA